MSESQPGKISLVAAIFGAENFEFRIVGAYADPVKARSAAKVFEDQVKETREFVAANAQTLPEAGDPAYAVKMSRWSWWLELKMRSDEFVKCTVFEASTNTPPSDHVLHDARLLFSEALKAEVTASLERGVA